jgi:hypothetical protein
MDWGDRGYWKVVTPHEVAHQWWRHTVGFSSYRDQWMREGFADMSASLYLSVIEKNPKKFITFWNDERELLLEGNHRMDWFFNEYVYGTQLPSYKMDSSFDIGADGDAVMNIKMTQSNVTDSFRMLVPVYLEPPSGMFFLGRCPTYRKQFFR